MGFLDAIREMQKYSSEEQLQQQKGMSHLDTQMQMHMRLFRAQRNFYIAGFALFLCLVIKRLVGLISANAGLQAEKEAAMKQAESASRTAEALLNDPVKAAAAGDGGSVEELREALAEAKKDAEGARKDVESMKSQAANLAEEYDRLCEEKNKLEKKLAIMPEDKKDD